MVKINIIGTEPAPIRFDTGIKYLLRCQKDRSLVFLDTLFDKHGVSRRIGRRERDFYQKVLHDAIKKDHLVISTRGYDPSRFFDIPSEDKLDYVADMISEIKEISRKMCCEVSRTRKDALALIAAPYSYALHKSIESDLKKGCVDIPVDCVFQNLEKWEPEEFYVENVRASIESGQTDDVPVIRYARIERIYRKISVAAGYGDVSISRMKEIAYSDIGSLVKYESAKERVMSEELKSMTVRDFDICLEQYSQMNGLSIEEDAGKSTGCFMEEGNENNVVPLFGQKTST